VISIELAGEALLQCAMWRDQAMIPSCVLRADAQRDKSAVSPVSRCPVGVGSPGSNHRNFAAGSQAAADAADRARISTAERSAHSVSEGDEPFIQEPLVLGIELIGLEPGLGECLESVPPGEVTT